MKLLNLFSRSKKVELDRDQYTVINGIANELNIPKEEVLWLFIEFGQQLAIASQTEGNEELAKSIDKRGHLPEYKNWKEIARINYQNWQTGGKLHEAI